MGVLTRIRTCLRCLPLGEKPESGIYFRRAIFGIKIASPTRVNLTCRTGQKKCQRGLATRSLALSRSEWARMLQRGRRGGDVMHSRAGWRKRASAGGRAPAQRGVLPRVQIMSQSFPPARPRRDKSSDRGDRGLLLRRLLAVRSGAHFGDLPESPEAREPRRERLRRPRVEGADCERHRSRLWRKRRGDSAWGREGRGVRGREGRRAEGAREGEQGRGGGGGAGTPGAGRGGAGRGFCSRGLPGLGSLAVRLPE